MIKPSSKGRIQIADVAFGIDGEEPGRSVIEIVDRMMELMENVLLMLALMRHISDCPHGQARVTFV
jgi:hypothetical protein